ncbi:TRAP transporter small permease [Castellaniella daejeonensis]|jgi:TRAP-type C4-dicarboxylate transport system permease small subunit|uniref:TRAP transporter small permease protein n=2 Tax=Castellaniella TaxID=359336 RepID=A0ABN0TKS4_9BURK
MMLEDKDRHAIAPRIRALSDLMFAVLTAGLALCVFAMLVLVFGNVVLRYAFNSGINVSSEIARLAFVWLTFGGAVLAFRAREHLAINMGIERFSPRVQKFVHLVRQLLILWVLWLIITGGWEQTVISMRTVTPVVGMPIAVFSGAVLFSAVAMALMVVLDLFVAWRTPATPENAGAFRTSVDSVEDI